MAQNSVKCKHLFEIHLNQAGIKVKEFRQISIPKIFQREQAEKI